MIILPRFISLTLRQLGNQNKLKRCKHQCLQRFLFCISIKKKGISMDQYQNLRTKQKVDQYQNLRTKQKVWSI